MKKIIFALSLCLGAYVLQAQDSLKVTETPKATEQSSEEPVLKSKRGAVILPEAGDWKITAGTGALFGYVGNLFAKDNNTYFPSNIFNNNSFSAGYFKTAKKAYTVFLNIDSRTSLQNNFVQDDLYTGPGFQSVKDVKNSNYTSVRVGFGVEHRRGGQKRFQKYFGYVVNVNVANDYASVKYGNSFSATNTDPNSSLSGGSFGDGFYYAATSRQLERNNGLTLGASIEAKVGVEYFFAPKMCVGGTFLVGPSVSRTSGGYRTVETWTGSETNVSKYKLGNTTNINLLTSTSVLYLGIYF